MTWKVMKVILILVVVLVIILVVIICMRMDARQRQRYYSKNIFNMHCKNNNFTQ